jgi:hypothetical protein
MRVERALMVVTPMMTMAVVTLGMRWGADSAERAAVVVGAPLSGAGTGLAWQVLTFEEDHGMREPIAVPDVSVAARAAQREAHWHGATNEDGAAEVLLAIGDARRVALEVRAGGALLAAGDAEVPGSLDGLGPPTAWTRFTRREGTVALDVAVLGQRVASGFPASLWVHATDPTTHAAIAGATIEPEQDASLSSDPAQAQTDSRGWAHVMATPMGHAVALTLHARTPQGKTGLWAGALFVSPGAAQLSARDRYSPDEEPALDIVMPNVRTTAYVEIDDARGRVWASAVPLAAREGGLPGASIRAPHLAPGLYWAVASSDPAAGAQLGPGTSARPFFVASSDEQALAYGTDRAECAPPHDPRELARALSSCAALVRPTSVPRATVLDGFAAQHAQRARRRARGMALSLGAIAIAMILETVLLLRTARRARMRLNAAASEEELVGELGDERAGRAGKLGIALLVAMLGFVLLAAFLVRAG